MPLGTMLQSGKSAAIVGYNVQTAVDGKHHLIVPHEVTNIGNDRTQLTKMAVAAREAMGKTKLQTFARETALDVRRSKVAS